MRLDRPALAAGLWLVPILAYAEPRTVFVQWGEQHLVAGDVEDAPNDVSWTLSWFGVDEVTMPAVTPGPGQDLDQLVASTMQIVETQWAAFDVDFVVDRPLAGDFDLITMGGTANLVNLGGAGGWGIVDCYDANHTSVAFTFSDSVRADDDTLDPVLLGQIISQEVAHTMGLEHLDESNELIMFPSATGQVTHFGEECFDIVDPITDPDHPEYCLDHPTCPMGQQNDTAHLLAYLGPAGADPDPTGGTGGTGEASTGGGTGDPATGGAATGGGSEGDGSGGSTDGDPTSGTTTPGGDTDTDGEGSGDADGGDDESCSCRTETGPGPVWTGLLGLLAMPRIRRRRALAPVG